MAGRVRVCAANAHPDPAPALHLTPRDARHPHVTGQAAPPVRRGRKGGDDGGHGRGSCVFQSAILGRQYDQEEVRVDKDYVSAVRGAGQGLGCDEVSAKGPSAGSPRRAVQPYHCQGAGKGRASVSGDQTPVRPCESALPRAGQEPCPVIHPVRARHPVCRPKKVDGMGTSLHKNGRKAANAAINPRRWSFLPERGVIPTPRPPSRRSQRR